MNSGFKITKNTDGVDIRENCVGLDATRYSFPKDVAKHIHTNRGLHIQIRHNKDPQTFGQANALSDLISAAPEMLRVLEWVSSVAERRKSLDENELSEIFITCFDVIKKARGKFK